MADRENSSVAHAPPSFVDDSLTARIEPEKVVSYTTARDTIRHGRRVRTLFATFMVQRS
jgi:hypothetical protein